VTELVINAPHLQTRRQRIGAVAVAVAGWLLWCYFLFPLLALGCWFLDDEECSQWVNLSGGYLNLKDILTFYVKTVAAIFLAWTAWTAYDWARRWRSRPAPAPQAVSAKEICEAFQVDLQELERCRASRYAVVHYDAQGHIVGLETG
jgi:poly-beta-1,6-N-acetyl-D-glucosamine biosynthesis protein PgaD